MKATMRQSFSIDKTTNPENAKPLNLPLYESEYAVSYTKIQLEEHNGSTSLSPSVPMSLKDTAKLLSKGYFYNDDNHVIKTFNCEIDVVIENNTIIKLLGV